MILDGKPTIFNMLTDQYSFSNRTIRLFMYPNGLVVIHQLNYIFHEKTKNNTYNNTIMDYIYVAIVIILLYI